MIHLREVSKEYLVGGETVVGLQQVTLDVERGDFVCVRGESGSGKTTLLLTMGGMQRPTRGKVGIAGCDDLYALDQQARTKIRAEHIGFVFQLFHLVPYLNVLENIQLGKVKAADAATSADELVDKLGLGHRRQHHPAQLSVGECQRVAVARALISEPDVLLADEPTGNLDDGNASIVMSAFQDFCRDGGALLLATHREESAAYASRVLMIDRGVVKEQVEVA